MQLTAEQDATILRNYTRHSLQMAAAAADDHRVQQATILNVDAEQRVYASEEKGRGN